MSISAFPKLKQKRRKPLPKIADVTLRDFSGGLRATDNELALTNKYATILTNLLPDTDTSMVLRFGTKEFATTSANIVNKIYFRQHIVAVLTSGEIQKITDAGVVTTIWNTAIAAALPGAPAAWSSGFTYVDFSEFRGELVICNGVDKPLLVDGAVTVDYLQDIAIGTNVNTPIGRFVTTVANYTIIAGLPAAPTTVYVSSTGTSGVWPNDAAPNDSTSFDVGAYTGQSSSEIIGLGSFKNFLIIFFPNFSVTFLLGQFDGSSNHVPVVDETYDELGTFNHKTILTTKSDLIFPANSGVYSAEKNVFGGTLTTESMSDDLGDAYPQVTGLITEGDLNSFIVNDSKSKTLFLVLHKADASIQTFAMKYKGDFKKSAWARIDGWDFTTGCTSEKGRVFFSVDDKIYQYGNSVFTDEAYSADKITDVYDGDEIAFDWEFPWLDAGNRIKGKTLHKVGFDTTGTSEYTLQCFVNNFYKDMADDYDPAAEMLFVAGGAAGYGVNSPGYGGSRRANDERFYGFPIKFKILKMRIFGSTILPLRIVAISLIYTKGNYNS